MFKLIKLLLIGLFFVSTAGFAEDEPKSVIVSGTGGTREIALNNAFRHAVEQAVGLMVSSESYVKNLKDIQDKIFLASNGFIEQYKILTEDNDSTGYAVTISAVVRQKQLKTAMSTATNTVMSLDGGALFANQMLKEEMIKNYSYIITLFLDDLIENGFEYKYDSPELIPSESNNTYRLKIPNLKVYLKKDWLSTLSRYRDKLNNEEVFNDALKILEFSNNSWGERDDRLDIYIGFRVELLDEKGNIIVGEDVLNKYVHEQNFMPVWSRAKKILGLFYYKEFRYQNTADEDRIATKKDSFFVTSIAKNDINRIKHISIRAVKVKDYGGKLPLYKGDGIFE